MYTKLYIFLPAYKIPNTEKVVLTDLFVIAMVSDKMSLSACVLFSMWILETEAESSKSEIPGLDDTIREKKKISYLQHAWELIGTATYLTILLSWDQKYLETLPSLIWQFQSNI